jgi:hypothetical protein
VLADFPEVIHHQLDEQLLARADARLPPDANEQRPLASKPFPGDHQVIDGAVSTLLEPDPSRGHITAKARDGAA